MEKQHDYLLFNKAARKRKGDGREMGSVTPRLHDLLYFNEILIFLLLSTGVDLVNKGICLNICK